MDFRWTEWNAEHVARHGVEPEAEEEAVLGARRGFPRRIGDEKWLVWGADESGRPLQVVFVLDKDGSVFVIQPPRAPSSTRRWSSRDRGH